MWVGKTRRVLETVARDRFQAAISSVYGLALNVPLQVRRRVKQEDLLYFQ